MAQSEAYASENRICTRQRSSSPLSPRKNHVCLKTSSSPVAEKLGNAIAVQSKRQRRSSSACTNEADDEYRAKFCEDCKLSMKECEAKQQELLTELFFLQNGGFLVDYYTWTKQPNTLLACYLKSERLGRLLSHGHSANNSLNGDTSVDVLGTSSDGNYSDVQDSSFCDVSLADASAASTSREVSLHRTASDADHRSSLGESSISTRKRKLKALLAQSSTGLPVGCSTPNSASSDCLQSTSQTSVLDSSVVGGQESIAELARQEAEALEKISELRKRGLWSLRRLPRASEPVQSKVHWDYVLEEMQWLSSDFAQERKWKRAGTRRVARMVFRYHQDRQMQEVRAEKEDTLKLRRIASNIAKCVREFWSNIEKVVQYKQRSRLDEKRRKALDMHLSYIVGQTEKYSSWLVEGLAQPTSAQVQAPAAATTDEAEGCAGESAEETVDDDDFDPDSSSTDDEETLEKEEELAEQDEDGEGDELSALQKESEIPIEELLAKYAADVDTSDAETSTTDRVKSVEVPVSGSSGDEQVYRSARLKERAERRRSSVEQSDFIMPSLKKRTLSESIKVEEEEDNEPGTEFLIKPLEKDGQENVNNNPAEENESGKNDGINKQMTDISAAAMSIQPTGYTLETAQVKTCVPFLIKHTLREYQHVGLDWLATMYDQRLNGILADEMGLGKTIQTIALLAYLVCEKSIWGPHLIVVPTSVILNWEMEFKKWCPALKILTYYGSLKERKAKRQGWTKTNAFHVCITSYKLVVQDHQAFRRKKWKYFILDEAQNIKNFKSQRWQMLLNFQSQRRLLLTGTPLQNNLMELWSLMHFLMPHVFQSHKEFKEWFSNPLTGMVEGSREYNEQLVRRLHKVLRPFLLRRLKADVEKQMPKKFEHVVMCRLSKRQRYLYDDFMSQTKTRDSLATGHFMSVINILMQLRKVCNHPSLFDARPTISSFHMEGFTYVAPSLVVDLATRCEMAELLACRTFCLQELEMSVMSARRIEELRPEKQDLIEVLSSAGEDEDWSDQSASECWELPEDLKILLSLESLDEKRAKARRDRVEWCWRHNESVCRSNVPLYGQSLRHLLDCLSSEHSNRTTSLLPVRNNWLYQGYVSCTTVHQRRTRHESTSFMAEAVKLPAVRLVELEDMFERFVFVIAPASSPPLQLHCSHPDPHGVLLRTHTDASIRAALPPRPPQFHKIEANQSVQFPDLRLIQYDCGKLQTLDVLLRQLKTGSHRVLIFTQMTRMLDILESFLNFHGHRYLRLDGSTKVEQRQMLMERFNVDTRIFVFILSTRSGGIGVNLTGADTVIFYDSDWNPTMDAQAQDRCHRIGQTRDVHIYRLISERTVEENILKKANEKRLLGNVAIEGGNFTTAFFRQQTISDLFHEPTGLEKFVKEMKSAEESSAISRQASATAGGSAEKATAVGSAETSAVEKPPVSEATAAASRIMDDEEAAGKPVGEVTAVDKMTAVESVSKQAVEAGKCAQLGGGSVATVEGEGLNEEMMEQALCAAEEESDIKAAEEARAERKAELAEFDENIPWEEGEGRDQQSEEQSKVEQELISLEKELMPIERYAVTFVEQQLAPFTGDELLRADEEATLARENWELQHLKAVKEEEERRAEVDEDEMLYTSSLKDLSQHYRARLEEERRKQLELDDPSEDEEPPEVEELDDWDTTSRPASFDESSQPISDLSFSVPSSKQKGKGKNSKAAKAAASRKRKIVEDDTDATQVDVVRKPKKPKVTKVAQAELRPEASSLQSAVYDLASTKSTGRPIARSEVVVNGVTTSVTVGNSLPDLITIRPPQVVTVPRFNTRAPVRFSYQAEGRPTPILEKLGVNVMKDSSLHIPMANLSQGQFLVSYPDGMVTSQVLTNGIGGASGVRYVLARPHLPEPIVQNSFSVGQRIVLMPNAAQQLGNFSPAKQNVLIIPGGSPSASNIGGGMQFVQHASPGRGVPVNVTGGIPCMPPGMRPINLQQVGAVNSAIQANSGNAAGITQNILVAHGSGNSKQYYILPSSALASGQSFILAPRSAGAVPTVRPSLAAVRPSPAALQQLPQSQRLIVRQMGQQQFVVTRPMMTSGGNNVTIPILEKLARQLVDNKVPSVATQNAVSFIPSGSQVTFIPSCSQQRPVGSQRSVVEPLLQSLMREQQASQQTFNNSQQVASNAVQTYQLAQLNAGMPKQLSKSSEGPSVMSNQTFVVRTDPRQSLTAFNSEHAGVSKPNSARPLNLNSV